MPAMPSAAEPARKHHGGGNSLHRLSPVRYVEQMSTNPNINGSPLAGRPARITVMTRICVNRRERTRRPCHRQRAARTRLRRDRHRRQGTRPRPRRRGAARGLYRLRAGGAGVRRRRRGGPPGEHPGAGHPPAGHHLHRQHRDELPHIHAATQLGLRAWCGHPARPPLGLPFDTPPRYAPVDEDHYPHPTTSYALSKVTAETLPGISPRGPGFRSWPCGL